MGDVVEAVVERFLRGEVGVSICETGDLGAWNQSLEGDGCFDSMSFVVDGGEADCGVRSADEGSFLALADGDFLVAVNVLCAGNGDFVAEEEFIRNCGVVADSDCAGVALDDDYIVACAGCDVEFFSLAGVEEVVACAEFDFRKFAARGDGICALAAVDGADDVACIVAVAGAEVDSLSLGCGACVDNPGDVLFAFGVGYFDIALSELSGLGVNKLVWVGGVDSVCAGESGDLVGVSCNADS